MAVVKINFAGTKVELLDKLLAEPTAALQRIGAHLVARSQRAFREQGRGGDSAPWPERMVPNVMGILRDLDRGPTIKKRRTDPRPAAVDTNELRNSITFSPLGKRAIKYGSNKPYTSRQNFGGKSKLWVSKRMLDNLTIVLRKERGKFKRAEKKAPGSGSRLILDLGWLYSFRGEFYEINVRPREFIAFDSLDHAAAERIVKEEAEKL